MFDIYVFAIEAEKLWLAIVFFIVTSLCLKQIKDPWLRKWYLTIQGIVLAVLILGFRTLEYIGAALATSAMIKLSGPRYCHIITMVVLMTMLNYFRFLYRDAETYNNILVDYTYMKFIAVMTGVACDIHNSHKEKLEKDKQIDEKIPKIYPMDDYLTNPSFWDLMHFNMLFLTYFGVYQRYRTYDDFIKLPFARHVKFSKLFIWKFALVLIIRYVYFEWHGKYFPQEFLLTEDFKNMSIFYQVLYSMTQHLALRMYLMYFFITMEFVCCSIGFGAYPVEGENISGHGPTKNYTKLCLMSEEQCANTEYDFKTVQSFDMIYVLTYPWMFGMVKKWNMTTQYWLSSSTYKQFYSNPKDRALGMILTTIISILWHGYEFGWWLGGFILLQNALASRLFYKIYKKYTNGFIPMIVIVLVKILLEIMLGFGFTASLLLNYDANINYLNATYWVPVLFAIPINVIGYWVIPFLNMKIKKKGIVE